MGILIGPPGTASLAPTTTEDTMNERPAPAEPATSNDITPGTANPTELTDQELLQITAQAQIYRFQATAGDPVQYEPTEAQLLAAFRAVIAADRAGRPAPVEPGLVKRLPDGKPYPNPPAEGEAAELAAALLLRAAQNPLGFADPVITRAAALLQRHEAELATLRQEGPHG